MKAVTIHDLEPDSRCLAVDLGDILELLDATASEWRWRCDSVECMGPGAETLHNVSTAGLDLSTWQLVDLARQVNQVVNGDFVAYDTERGKRCLRIRAIDSTMYVIVTADSRMLERITRRFHDVRDSPEDACGEHKDQWIREAVEQGDEADKVRDG